MELPSSAPGSVGLVRDAAGPPGRPFHAVR